MPLFSIIDFDNQDFVRDENGKVIKINASHACDASDWFAEFGEQYTTGTTIRVWDWEAEENNEGILAE